MNKTLAIVLLLVLFGAGGAWLVLDPDAVNALRARLGGAPPAAAGVGETALEHARKHLDPKYTCPMHPGVIRDEPGNCPLCGMTLVPLEQEEKAVGEDGAPVVKVSPAVINALGVRTAAAEKGRLWRRIDTVGFVDYDEQRMAHVHTRTKGWIERLTVRSEGERVKRGDLLFELYSPELVNAQEEFVQALRIDNKGLIAASRDRLLSLGLSEAQVRAVTRERKVRQRVEFHAPQDGVVSALNAREGMYVTPAKEVMALADLAEVWVITEVFERQSDWVAPGQPAEVRLSYLPGRTWEGEVEFIYPDLDPKSRTLRARLRFPNPDEVLKPNMYADITLYGGAKQEVINIPREALIRTGENERVILALGEGRFQPRTVVSGIESGERVEILQGLAEGEKVVTSSQFLIDSEASIKASLARMQEM